MPQCLRKAHRGIDAFGRTPTLRALFTICQRWLVISSIGFALVGLLLALAPDSLPFTLWLERYGERFAPASPDQRHFFSGMLGGTILGFYVTAAFIAAIPFRRRERWAWWALVSGLVAWFVIDSAMSVSHDAVFNVLMVNCTTLVAHGVPLALTASYFFGRRSK